MARKTSTSQAPSDKPDKARKSRPPASKNQDPAGGETDDAEDCIVVGIGASAGGLEAYRKLLAKIETPTGCAFVLVNHLDSTHESLMAGLLGKHTNMPVLQVDSPIAIRPDHVYIIPPNKFIRLTGNGLALSDPVKSGGVRMPVDHFFRSLAETRGERAVGIVLSGTGSDGSQSIREIKAAGGLTIAQEPGSAEFDGMPASAIQTGKVDFILPLEKIPEVLARYSRNPYLSSNQRKPDIHHSSPSDFGAILDLLLERTGHDFHGYKKGTLSRRIQRRMGLRHVESPEGYLELLQSDEAEIDLLFNDLLIGVTRFFRDRDLWDELRKEVVAPLVRMKKDGEPIRIWVPGCASGEEAYTMAIIVQEELDSQGRGNAVQIFATDLDGKSIQAARSGRYPVNIAADVPAGLLKRHFTTENGLYRPGKRLRELCVFAVQNLVSDPPFSNLDLISCRNLLIYLDSDIQERLTRLFHFALADEGTLFLGPSETVPGGERFFTTVSKSGRIYRKHPAGEEASKALPAIPIARTTACGGRVDKTTTPAPPVGTVEVAHRALLEAYAPASILIDKNNVIQYFHGHIRRFLDIPPGAPTSEIFAMTPASLVPRLRALLLQAAKTRVPVAGQAESTDETGKSKRIAITVRPVTFSPDGDYTVISFSEVLPHDSIAIDQLEETRRDPGGDPHLVSQLRYELLATRDDLQGTIEELETSNEELKASNEEIMSMNEELQSANEELETSREELQSLNEELNTVNSQLEEKIDELEITNDDLSNLLASTRIATIFLDPSLRIRRSTPACKRLLNVISGDIGRPISDLFLRVNDPDLLEDAMRVLENSGPVEKEVTDNEHNVYIRRILPFKTADGKIDGVVVTFVEVTQLKQVEQELFEREMRFSFAQKNAHFGIWERDLRTMELIWDRTTRDIFGIDPVEPLDDALVASRVHPDDLDHVRDEVVRRVKAGQELGTSHRIILPSGEVRWVRTIAHPIFDGTGKPIRMIGVVSDITEGKKAGDRIRESEEHLQAIFNQQFQFVAILSPEGVLTKINDLPINETGVARDESIGKPVWEAPWFTSLPDVQLLWQERLAEAAASDRTIADEFRFLAHGKVRTADTTITAVRDEQQNVSFFIVQASDTTEKKKADENLVRSERQFRGTFDNAAVGIAHLDPDGRWLLVNDRLCEICGYSREELFGMTFAEITHPDDLEADWANARSLLKGEISQYSMEKRYIHKKGHIVWINLTVSLLRKPDGEPDYFISIVRDISERIRVTRELMLSEERLNLAKDAAELGVYDLDPVNGTIHWDKRVREIWGVGPDEEITLETAFAGLHPDDRESAREAVAKAVDPNGDGKYYAEYRVPHPGTGETRWIASTGKSIFQDGRATRLIGFVQDITTRRESEYQLEELTERLEERVAERTSLAETQARNLRKLAVEITQAEESVRRSVASTIHDELQQLLVAAKMRMPDKDEVISADQLRAIDRLLDDAIKQSRSLVSQLSPAVLREGSLRDALDWIASKKAENYGMIVEVEGDDDCPALSIEIKSAVFSIVRELIFNIVKHSGRKEARVKLSCTEQEVHILVSDEGKGFDARKLEANGEKFGLFSIRERVFAFGGEFKIESEEGQGTRCHISIPLAD